jgi:hypothetical protein
MQSFVYVRIYLCVYTRYQLKDISFTIGSLRTRHSRRKDSSGRLIFCHYRASRTTYSPSYTGRYKYMCICFFFSFLFSLYSFVVLPSIGEHTGIKQDECIHVKRHTTSVIIIIIIIIKWVCDASRGQPIQLTRNNRQLTLGCASIMNNCSLTMLEYSQLVSLQKRHTNTYTFLLFNARICHLLTVAQCDILHAPIISMYDQNHSIAFNPLDSFFHRYIETMNRNECEKYSNEVRRKFILFILGIILSLLVIILNSIVTLTIVNSTKLRSLMTNIFLLNLSIADFLSGCSFLYPCLMNILVEYAVVNYNSILLTHLNSIRNNYYICLIAYAFIMSGMLMSVSILLSIAIDKYIYIFKPYSYQKILTKRRCLLWISSLWLISIFIGLLPLLGWNKIKRCLSIKQNLCSSNTCLIDRVFTTGYCSLFATISLLAAIVILYVYVRIFILARDHLMRIERLRSHCTLSNQPLTIRLTSNKSDDDKDRQRFVSLSCPSKRKTSKTTYRVLSIG